MLAGEVSKAMVSTLLAANKALRFAKANSDVQPLYTPLDCALRDIVFVAKSDAAFASRGDLSSQGGHPQGDPFRSGMPVSFVGLALFPFAAGCPIHAFC